MSERDLCSVSLLFAEGGMRVKAKQIFVLVWVSTEEQWKD
jgi:hypothetical protein